MTEVQRSLVAFTAVVVWLILVVAVWISGAFTSGKLALTAVLVAGLGCVFYMTFEDSR